MRFLIKMLNVSLLATIFTATVYGQGGEVKRIVFSPQWTAQAQFVGYYVAKDMGFYEEAGLDVEIIHPNKSVNALQMLKRQQSDIVSLDLITAMSENMDGGSLRNILQSSQRSSLSIISHKPISKIEDLAGFKIGQWKAGFSLIAHSVVDDLEVDVEWIDILGGINVFLSKAVDANLMMTYNELLTVEETGYEIDPNQMIYFRDIEGYNLPEEGLYTSALFAQENPDAISKFRDASIKGWLWARENRKEALDIVMKWVLMDQISTNRVHQRMMLDEIFSLQINESGEVAMKLEEEDFERAKSLLIRDKGHGSLSEYKSFIIR